MGAQAVATVNLAAARWLLVSGGYRYPILDWKDGGRQVDVRQHGPIAGATLRFQSAWRHPRSGAAFIALIRRTCILRTKRLPLRAVLPSGRHVPAPVRRDRCN
jgi:hypothetical protein